MTFGEPMIPLSYSSAHDKGGCMGKSWKRQLRTALLEKLFGAIGGTIFEKAAVEAVDDDITVNIVGDGCTSYFFQRCPQRPDNDKYKKSWERT